VEKRYRPIGAALAVCSAWVLAGCGGNEDTLHPASRPERSIVHLWWVMLGGAAAGLTVVVLLLLLGWWRRTETTLPGGGGERAATRLVVGLGIVVPMIVLTALFVWSDFVVQRVTEAPARGSTAMTIDVIGHQWWWEVRYPGTPAVTANEIHIPIRTRVEVVATTADVIHSFWVPELNRKVDMIPGLRNRVLLEADRPGTYRGQCAEFCGLQHAHMTVAVIAEPRAAFAAWLKRQERSAAGQGMPGARVFQDNSCASCHRIRGTPANGDNGPDLTHVASRSTLAAGTIANTPANLAAWIRDPQHVKPGNRMPDLHLDARDEAALVRYLESLR
jgi:cytochrome c oxidase subunit 2